MLPGLLLRALDGGEAAVDGAHHVGDVVDGLIGHLLEASEALVEALHRVLLLVVCVVLSARRPRRVVRGLGRAFLHLSISI
eukprot:scaffold16886_cov30-Phaeocystis_antarctica.AAC.1